MFGSLILPTGVVRAGGTGGGGSFFSSRPSSSSSSSYCSPRDQLSAIGSTPYHPTMSFPSRKSTGTRIRASFASPDTLPRPRVELSKSPTTTLNLYQILRIQHNASPLEIKTAYRRLAKQFHPDASPPPPATTSSSESSSSDDDDGARDFMKIHNAYATLSDPKERARYDLSIQTYNSHRRFHRYYSSSSSSSSSSASAATADGNENRSRSFGYGFQTTRWETDQCW